VSGYKFDLFISYSRYSSVQKWLLNLWGSIIRSWCSGGRVSACTGASWARDRCGRAMLKCDRYAATADQHSDVLGSEHRVERWGEFGVPVADEKPEFGGPVARVHQKIAGGLCGPGRSRMLGHTEDVDRRVRISITNKT
jgi:hypothetical protein